MERAFCRERRVQARTCRRCEGGAACGSNAKRRFSFFSMVVLFMLRTLTGMISSFTGRPTAFVVLWGIFTFTTARL